MKKQLLWSPFLALAVFLPLACTTEIDPVGGTRPGITGRQKTPGPRESSSPTPSGPASPSTTPSAGVTPTPTATPYEGTDVSSGISTFAPTPVGATVPPVIHTSPSPTPLGQSGQQILVAGGPRALAFTSGATSPWVLRTSDLARVDATGQVTATYNATLDQPVGMAADGPEIWVASARNPHVDRLSYATGDLVWKQAFALAATPSAVAASGGEAWVALADGEVLRMSGGATTSVGAFGSPVAIALDADNAWVLSAPDRLRRVNRVTFASADPVAVGNGASALAIGGDGTVWVSHASGATRVPPGQAAAAVALGSRPLAVATSGARAWFGLADGRLVCIGADGAEAGGASIPFTVDLLGTDALDRVWAGNQETGRVVPVWGR